MSQDAHRRTAEVLFEKDAAEVTQEERRIGKYLNVLVATYVDNPTVIAKLVDICGMTREDATSKLREFKQKVLGTTGAGLEND